MDVHHALDDMLSDIVVHGQSIESVHQVLSVTVVLCASACPLRLCVKFRGSVVLGSVVLGSVVLGSVVLSFRSYRLPSGFNVITSLVGPPLAAASAPKTNRFPVGSTSQPSDGPTTAGATTFVAATVLVPALNVTA